MKTLMFAAALCAGMLNSQAQTTDTKHAPTTPQVAEHPGTNCMGATKADWKSLGLNAEQHAKVMDIQAECKKECAGKKEGDPTMAVSMDNHEALVKEVLTPAQHDAWMKWCTAQAAPTKSMEKK